MPKNSRVDRCYQKVKKEGHSEESAAKICQASTGQALSTGKPPKGKRLVIYPRKFLPRNHVVKGSRLFGKR